MQDTRRSWDTSYGNRVAREIRHKIGACPHQQVRRDVLLDVTSQRLEEMASEIGGALHCTDGVALLQHGVNTNNLIPMLLAVQLPGQENNTNSA